MSARGKLCAEGEIYKARGSYCERNNTACLLCAPSEPTPSNPKDTNSELMSTGLKLASAQHSVCSHHMARLPHSIIILCRAPRPARTRAQHHVSVAQREFRNPPPETVSAWKGSPPKWLMYSTGAPGGSALYWQSRMVKALVSMRQNRVTRFSHYRNRTPNTTTTTTAMTCPLV